MMHSEFWVMLKNNSSDVTSPAHSVYPGRNFPSISIVELTQDELVYVWPKEPLFASLCLVCKNLNLHSVTVCNSDKPAGYPCNFQAVPEAMLSQDFDDFLVDGEYLVECGYFYSFEDFRRQNGYSDEDFYCYMLGRFPSIRAARQALKAVNHSTIK